MKAGLFFCAKQEAGGLSTIQASFSPPEFFRTERPSHRSPEPLARALRQKCGLLTGRLAGSGRLSRASITM